MHLIEVMEARIRLRSCGYQHQKKALCYSIFIKINLFCFFFKYYNQLVIRNDDFGVPTGNLCKRHTHPFKSTPWDSNQFDETFIIMIWKKKTFKTWIVSSRPLKIQQRPIKVTRSFKILRNDPKMNELNNERSSDATTVWITLQQRWQKQEVTRHADRCGAVPMQMCWRMEAFRELDSHQRHSCSQYPGGFVCASSALG